MTFDAFWSHNHAWAISVLVVGVTAYSRFNNPPTSRSSTTWARYHVLACMYTLALAASWIVLANTPSVVPSLAGVANLGGNSKSLEAPVYAAVLLTVLVGVPPFAAFDTKVRQFLHDLARIPWEARRLSAALRSRTWLPDETFQGEIRRTLHEAGFSDVDMSFSGDHTPQALWTRITALQRYVENWEQRDGKFAGFYFSNIAAVGQLKEEYQGVEAQARRVFPILKSPRNPGGDSSLDRIHQELARSFIGSAERLEKDLCDLVSRGVLTCSLTERARRSEFETIGFMVNVAPSHLFDNMLGLYVCLSALYIVVLTLADRPKPVLAGMVIVTIYMGAVSMALAFKQPSWARYRRNLRYVSAAAAAFGFASLASLGWGLLLTFDVRTAWQQLSSRWWPWGLMSVAVAALVAYFIDHEDRPGTRRQEAAAMMIVCALMAFPIVWLLNRVCGGAVCDAPPYWRVTINAALTGGLIGFFVPTWYRSPEVMVSGYERFKIVVTALTKPDGVLATIQVVPPKLPGDPRPSPVQLPHEIEDVSVDAAIAEAIRTARAWVDERRRGSRDAAGATLQLASTGS